MTRDDVKNWFHVRDETAWDGLMRDVLLVVLGIAEGLVIAALWWTP